MYNLQLHEQQMALKKARDLKNERALKRHERDKAINSERIANYKSRVAGFVKDVSDSQILWNFVTICRINFPIASYPPTRETSSTGGQRQVFHE